MLSDLILGALQLVCARAGARLDERACPHTSLELAFGRATPLHIVYALVSTLPIWQYTPSVPGTTPLHIVYALTPIWQFTPPIPGAPIVIQPVVVMVHGVIAGLICIPGMHIHTYTYIYVHGVIAGLIYLPGMLLSALFSLTDRPTDLLARLLTHLPTRHVALGSLLTH